MYAVHLLDSGQAGLLPPYACHLRGDLRADVFALHLRLLTEVLWVFRYIKRASAQWTLRNLAMSQCSLSHAPAASLRVPQSTPCEGGITPLPCQSDGLRYG